MQLMTSLESRFRFVHVASRRARQLMGGARPLMDTVTRKPTRIACEEVLAGLIQFEAVESAGPVGPTTQA